MNHLISASDFKKLANHSNVKVFDVRYGPTAKEDYKKTHIENAVFADLDTQLSHVDNPAQGGRHPLPSVNTFVNQLGQWGVENSSHVVLYDASTSAMAAARMWWMLKSIGHEKVQVLNGGLKAAQVAGVAMGNASTTVNETTYHTAVSNWQWPTADMNHVVTNLISKSQPVVDVRAANRFAGLTEPIDPIAGHIPNAVNIPLMQNTQEDGTFKTADELKQLYAHQFEAETPIFHCGSGVTACHSILATQIAGLPLPQLYVGSWSEWSRSKQLKITKYQN